MLRVSNNNTIMAFSSTSIVDFEQVNVIWVLAKVIFRLLQ